MSKFYSKIKSQCKVQGCCHKQFMLPKFEGYEDYYVDKQREQIDFSKDPPSGENCANFIHRIRQHIVTYHTTDSVDNHVLIGYSKGKYDVQKNEGGDSEDSD